MKKNPFILLLLLVLIGFQSCKDDDDDGSVQAITMGRSTLPILIGDNFNFEVDHFPAQLRRPSYTWVSSDESIATVDNKGNLSTLEVGECEVTVYTSNKKISSICNVSVNPIKSEGVSLDKTELDLEVGFTTTLICTIFPEETTYKEFTWSSSNEEIATVSEGVITGVSVGEVVITATVNDTQIFADCAVVVTPKKVPTESITLDQNTLMLNVYDVQLLNFEIFPYHSIDKNVTWTSSNEDIATVDVNGEVTTLAAGEVTIKASVDNTDKFDECVVTVSAIEAESITLSTSKMELIIGKDEQLTFDILPLNTTNKNVVWSSSNETVATVVDGLVTAITEGDATITATVEGTNVSYDCAINVTPEHTYVSFGGYSAHEGEFYIIVQYILKDDSDANVDKYTINYMMINNAPGPAATSKRFKFFYKNKKGGVQGVEPATYEYGSPPSYTTHTFEVPKGEELGVLEYGSEADAESPSYHNFKWKL